MKRTITVLATLMLVVGSLAAVVPASAVAGATQASSSSVAATSAATSNHTANDSNASISPGARLSGVIGVQEAELQGEVESRAFGIKVAKAATDDAKAKVVAQQLNESEKRIEELESELDELERAKENGSISNGTYAARAAQVQTKLNNVERQTNESAEVAEGLPNETLEANNINVSAIRTLSQRAANLSGPEVAAIAQTIAGPSAGQRPAEADNRTAGPDAGNRTAGSDAGDRTAGSDSGNRTAGGADDGDDESGSGSDSGSESGSSGGSDGYGG